MPPRKVRPRGVRTLRASMSDTKRALWPWIALVALYLGLRLPALLTYAPTYDEPIYVGAGTHFVKTGDGAAAPMLYHPPLAYHLTSAPLWFLDAPTPAWNPKDVGSQVGLAVLYDSKTRGGAALSASDVILLSRLPILAFGLLGLFFANVLGRRLAGERAGFLAAAAWAAWPECAAQCVQATTDLAAGVAALGLACAAILHFDAGIAPRVVARRTHVVLGAAIGFAAMSKHTLLLPIAIVVVAALWLRIARRRAGMAQQPGAPARFVVAAVVAFFVLWAGYLFEFGPIAARAGGGHEHSAAIARWTGLDVSTVERFVESVSVPMPTYWRSVADAFLDKARARAGTTWSGYLNGEWNDAGFLWYFPVALLVKTPTALIVLMFAGFAGFRALRRESTYAADLCLALFAIPFAAAIASRLNIGVRHLLPTAPFTMILGAAALGLWWEKSPAAARTTAIVLAAALGVEWAANRVDPLPFANLPSGGPNRLHERLADSNLEAGQDLWAVEAWCEAHRVESAYVLLHDPQGLYERERAEHPYLRPRDANPWSFVEPILNTPQTGDVPRTGIVAVGESEIVRPLGWSRLAEVEPLARVGRTRIYKTAP